MPTTVCAGGDILGDDRIGADLGALADLDRAEHLRARADHDAVADGRVALAADAGRRVGAAQRDMLVNGDVVADLGALADDAEAVVEEEALADLRAGMNVDRGQEAREMVDQPREEIEVPLPQPVRERDEGRAPSTPG